MGLVELTVAEAQELTAHLTELAEALEAAMADVERLDWLDGHPAVLGPNFFAFDPAGVRGRIDRLMAESS